MIVAEVLEGVRAGTLPSLATIVDARFMALGFTDLSKGAFLEAKESRESAVLLVFLR
jgi:hypothetical protein